MIHSASRKTGHQIKITILFTCWSYSA